MSLSGSGDLNPERKEFIRILSEEEFFGKHDEYKLCKNANDEYKYILEQELVNNSEFNLLSNEELLAYKNLINKRKLNEAPLTPAGLSLKQRYLKDLEAADRARKGIENYHDDEPVDHRKWYQKVSFLILIPVVLAILMFYVLYQNRDTYGSVKIISDVKIAEVYLNGSEIVLDSSSTVTKLNKGSHIFRFIMENGEEYEKRINIFSENQIKLSLQNLKVKPKEIIKSNFGYVKFMVDSKLKYNAYIRDSIVDFNNWIKLSVGNYLFRVEKEGYRSEPSFRSFLINSGDSIRLPFKFNKIRVKEKVIYGTIDVSSNINSAEIFINDKSSGYHTNHIFSDLPAGRYKISVKKEGYKLIDQAKYVTINENLNFASLRFNLENSSTLLSIETKGQSAAIYLDKKVIGKGRVTTNIDYGKHLISFEKIAGYYTPKSIEIDFSQKFMNDLIVRYYPVINEEVFVNNSGFSNSEFNVKYGYSKFDKFVNDIENSAKRVVLNGKPYYEIKYPFPYNNPKAGHAFLYNFVLPNTFSYEQDLNLYLYLYYTKENYSLTGSLNPKISLIINNRRKYFNTNVKHSFENDESRYQKFKINDLLQNGKNEILIYAPESNNSVLRYRGFIIKK